MYNIQFGVLLKYENDTWYDQKGNIVFLVNSGLKRVGLERRIWEAMRGTLSDDGLTYSGYLRHTNIPLIPLRVIFTEVRK